VTHNTKPFVNRIRYVPEVASRPDRIEKDLANAKILASMLEDEAAFLRSFSPSTSADSMDTNGDAQPGDMITGGTHQGNEDSPQPKEVGSQAVERRIEKILADLREQGVEEKSIEANRVRSSPTSSNSCTLTSCVAGNFFGFVSCLSPRSIPHVLLLRCCYRSF